MGRVEVVQVAQQKSRRIANLAVHIRHLLEDVAPQRHIGGIVHRRHPQAQHVGPVGRILLLVFAAVDHNGWIHHVADRLAHLTALLVEGKAVGEHCFVRGVAIHRHAGQQAALEPAPMLVRPLQIHIHGVGQFAALLGHRRPG